MGASLATWMQSRNELFKDPIRTMLAQLSSASGKPEGGTINGGPGAATAPLDTSLIHAYDAPLLPSPPALENGAPPASHDRLTSRASNMLCCFTSAAGYYAPQRDEMDPDAGESASCSDSGTGELRVFDAAPSTWSLLRPQAPQHSGRATLVLDLDETLVHSSFRPIPDADFALTVDVQGTVMNVYVMKRPWLDVFLQQAARVFEVVVFTASLGMYADAVLDHLDPLATVSGRLYRESCVLHGGSYVKDLARIGRPLERTVLVDNAAHSFAFQPANGLHSSTFIGDRSDTGLMDMMAVLLRIKDAPDVRPALAGAVAACGYGPRPGLE